VSGTVNAPLKEAAETTLHEPSLVFAHLFAERLVTGGVASATSAAIPCRLVGADEDLGAADETITVVRTPLSVVLERCNRESENLYAESMLKLVGKTATNQSGSWANGTGVVRMQVRDRLGPEFASTLFLADGSGMSRMNRVTAALLANWLVNLSRDPR